MINELMLEGYVTSQELSTQIGSRYGRDLTPRQIRTIIDRLKGMRLLAVVPRGQYATKLYSRRPIRRDTGNNRTALRAHADEWATGMQPTLQMLATAGFVKPIAIAAELNRRGIATSRGGPWTENVVKHLLARLKDMREREAS